MSEESIMLEKPAPYVTTLRLNRPSARNALSGAMIVRLAEILNGAATDRSVRAVILAGGDKAFSVGADIKEMVAQGLAALTAREREQGWIAIEKFPKPVIAAVEGYALGGGNELAMTADMIIAGENAIFGQPEVKIGVIPGDGGTQRLIRAVGKPMAMRMILSGEFIDAKTAFDAGLAADLVDAGKAEARALELAVAIAANAPISVRLAKDAVLQAEEAPLTSGLLYERKAMFHTFSTRDRAEGMQAFVEKRDPEYREE